MLIRICFRIYFFVIQVFFFFFQKKKLVFKLASNPLQKRKVFNLIKLNFFFSLLVFWCIPITFFVDLQNLCRLQVICFWIKYDLVLVTFHMHQLVLCCYSLNCLLKNKKQKTKTILCSPPASPPPTPIIWLFWIYFLKKIIL